MTRQQDTQDRPDRDGCVIRQLYPPLEKGEGRKLTALPLYILGDRVLIGWATLVDVYCGNK